MQSAPGTLVLGLVGQGISFVVFGTVLFSLVMSVLFLVTRGKDSMYDQIGQGGISRESDYAGTGGGLGAGDAAAAHSEQELEIRQLLRARSDRRVARGEAPLDVEAETERLLADARGAEHDPALLAEVRQLVEARNERRLRQGLDPLDVEAEVTRTLSELDGGV